LSELPGAGLQSEEEIATIAKEARIPVMTNQADDIDDLAGTLLL
jgi:seryl-tRNA(Sec) selenium transferase